MVSRYDRRLKRLSTVACEQCGLLRTDPMPTEAELERYYATDYRLDYQWAARKDPPRFHQTRSQREAEARYQLLAPLLGEKARILDVGSGSGEFLGLTAAAGHRSAGIEPGEAFADFARRTYRARVLVTSWQTARLKASSFDLICAHHVLEHLREPVMALRQLACWLKDDGILYISVPNALSDRKNPLQQFHFAHVHHFTPLTLRQAALAAGLEPDPRSVPDGTTLILRKRAKGMAKPTVPAGRQSQYWQRHRTVSPAAFLLSGRWLIDAAFRARKALADNRS